jgi:hypothetical protein
VCGFESKGSQLLNVAALINTLAAYEVATRPVHTITTANLGMNALAINRFAGTHISC